MRLFLHHLRRASLTAKRTLVVGIGLAVVMGLLVPAVLTSADASVGVNDYPSHLRNAGQDALVDPWDFYNRECTSFVAWRLNNDNHVPFTDYWHVHWGNASNWKNAALSSAAQQAGVRVNSTPTVGAVAWWYAGSAGSSRGHVAYIDKVTSSSITVEEYNYLHEGGYDQRVISRSSSIWPSGFIHFGNPKVTNVKPPVVSGTPKVGQKLTSSWGTWSPSGNTMKFQWLADGTPISGATGRAFTPAAAQKGAKISVRVTASQGSLKPATSTSSATAAVAPGTFNTAAPTISGTAQVGAPLTASTGSWSPQPSSRTFQWYADGNPIFGATAATYTPTSADLGKKISVKVTGSSNGYTSASAGSAQTAAVVPGVLQRKAAPSISGTPLVGSTLTASRGTWLPQPSTASYQWLVDGQPVKGATGARFTPRAGDYGKSVGVAVTLHRAGYAIRKQTVTAASKVGHGALKATRPASISGLERGRPVVGRRLTAAATWSATGAKTTRQWYRDGSPIKGATGAAYTPRSADVGHRLSVKLTGHAANYQSTSTTASAPAVVNGFAAFSRAPYVSGSAAPGNTLSAVAGSHSPASARVRYQWFRGNAPIRGATSMRHHIVTADLGHYLSVKLRLLAPGWVSASRWTSHTARAKAPTRMHVYPHVSGSTVRLHVSLAAPDVAAPTGQVVVREHGRVVGHGRIHGHGWVTFTRPSGRHHLRIRYAGSLATLPARDRLSVSAG